MTPGIRLFLATFVLLWALKLWTLIRTRTRPTFVYMLLWPGMNPLATAAGASNRTIEPQPFLRAWMRMIAGFTAIFALASVHDRLSDLALGWAGITAMLLAIHFGFADILVWLLRSLGFAVPQLFNRPWAAQSLDDFWSHRWNLAFVEMNRLLFLKPLRRWFGLRHAVTATFVLSGLFHELALSFPAGGGWGGPLVYFTLQAMLVHLRGLGRFAAWLCVLVPLPLLFHTPVRAAFIVPFYRGLGVWLQAQELLLPSITAAGIGHFLVLVASLQVPTRLGWRDDLAKLTSFNRKIFWVYSVFILFCILSFGAITLLFREDLAFPTQPLARALAALIGAFWTIRVLVDVFWYDHRDWPPGNAMVAGHALLTTLFLGVASTYWVAALR